MLYGPEDMNTPWHYRLRIDERTEKTIFLKLANQIIAEITSGRLKRGLKLPGTRTLAYELKINRKTVQLVYEDLEAQGWLTAKKREGTFVSDYFPEYVDIQADSSDQNLSVSLKVSSVFDDGVPDSSLIPYEIFSRAYRHALIQTTRNNLMGYSDPQGNIELRQEISNMLCMERFINHDLEQVCIVRGSQMGIFLISRILPKLLTRSKHILAIESLMYPPALKAFASNHYDVIKIKINEHGLNLSELESVLVSTPISALYITPHHQYPTTVTMPMEHRIQLLALSKKYDFYIIEDDYDHEFHYDSSPLPPLAALPNSEKVIHIGSLSKVFAPGIRIGYVVAQHEIIREIVEDIFLIDRQGNTMNELAVAELLKSGEIKRHIRKMRKIYQARRDYAFQTFNEVFKEQVLIKLPAGGMALWVKFLYPFTEQRMNHLKQLGFYVDHYFSCTVTPPQHSFHIRFGFASLTENEIKTMIHQLSALF